MTFDSNTERASIQSAIKNTISWLVLIADVAYGLWAVFMLLGAIFVMGGNDTALEIVGVLAFGLSPIAGAVLALIDRRRLAAACFGISATLWTVGVIDGERYLHQKFGPQSDHLALFTFLLQTAGVHLAFGLFYGVRDLLRWPAILSPFHSEKVD